MQVAFQEVRLPEDMSWMIMVMLPKGEGYFRGIGLVVVIWNVFTSMIYNCLCSATMIHDALHGFRQGWGTGTYTLKEKLALKLTGICHENLLQVFLDVRKAHKHDLIEWTRYMEVLKGYGLGSKLKRLLQQFWEDQVVVPKAGWYYGRPLKMGGGVTQGYTLTPTLFNIVFGAVVRALLL